MTRSSAREIAVHFVFELGFSQSGPDELFQQMLTRQTFELIGREEPLYAEFPNQEQRAYIEELVRGVAQREEELDGYISRYAIGWKLNRIPRVVTAILRVCMFEILYMQDIPNAAAINEAVELTKHYEESELCAFVNGILGSFVREQVGAEAGGSPAEVPAGPEGEAPEA